MPFPYTCPHCGRKSLVKDSYAGWSGPCVGCGQTITIQGTPSPVAPQINTTQSGKVGYGTAFLLLVIFLGVGWYLISPAVQASRETARHSACYEKLKYLEQALLQYHEIYNQFPPAYTVDESGKPLHSWRTLILPYLEQKPLWTQLRLDEPWNSPHNLAVFEEFEMPYLYRCQSSPLDDSKKFTNHVMVIGPNCISDGPTSCRLNELVNGPENTIHVVETTDPILWYEPKDLKASEITFGINDDTKPGISSYHPKRINVTRCNGYGSILSNTTDPFTLKALIEGKKSFPKDFVAP